MMRADHGGPPEVQVPGEQVGEGEDGATKLAIRLTAMVKINSARQASTSIGVLPIVSTMSVGLAITLPSILNWPPASTTTMTPKNKRVDGDAEEVAPDDRLLGLGAAGEVAEVQHEGAVDGHPERAAAEDLAPHLAAGDRVRRLPVDRPPET